MADFALLKEKFASNTARGIPLNVRRVSNTMQSEMSLILRNRQIYRLQTQQPNHVQFECEHIILMHLN